LDPERIYLAMLTGPQQMPVFDDAVLTPDDKRAIIGYLEALHARPTDGGFGLGGLGPVSEGLWAWIIGLGSLIFFAMWIAAKGVKAK
jgi:ubiquinol-cytochrome c reductase cytochrome c subunit